jgi:enoyl-CoA hydratase
VSVHFEVDEQVAVITIDRPEVANAIDRPTADALADSFRRFEGDDSLTVAVLTGAKGDFAAAPT